MKLHKKQTLESIILFAFFALGYWAGVNEWSDMIIATALAIVVYTLYLSRSSKPSGQNGEIDQKD